MLGAGVLLGTQSSPWSLGCATSNLLARLMGMGDKVTLRTKRRMQSGSLRFPALLCHQQLQFLSLMNYSRAASLGVLPPCLAPGPPAPRQVPQRRGAAGAGDTGPVPATKARGSGVRRAASLSSSDARRAGEEPLQSTISFR